jgi:hypothetical protein
MNDTGRSSRTQNSILADSTTMVVDKVPVVSKNKSSSPVKRESNVTNDIQEPRKDSAPTSSKGLAQDSVPFIPKPPGTSVDEQTLDWSKIMSFAEKQLEQDETKSVLSRAESKFSRVSRMTRQSRKSFFTAMGDDEKDLSNPLESENKETTESASSRSTSASTRATAAKEASNSGRAGVTDVSRDVSVLDVSSLGDEDDDDDDDSIIDGPRLLLTSLLLKFLRQCISFINESSHKSTEITSRSQILVDRQLTATARIAQFGEESAIFRFFRYIVFFLCFFLWPSGIQRRKVVYMPIPTKAEKPSLLKLVTAEERRPMTSPSAQQAMS